MLCLSYLGDMKRDIRMLVFTTGNVEKVIDLIKYTYRNILIFEIILKNRY